MKAPPPPEDRSNRELRAEIERLQVELDKTHRLMGQSIQWQREAELTKMKQQAEIERLTKMKQQAEIERLQADKAAISQTASDYLHELDRLRPTWMKP